MGMTMTGGLSFPGGGVLGFAAVVALKASILLLLAALTTRALSRGAASLRHFVWCLAVAGVLALPVIEATLPWSWEVLPSSRPAAVEALANVPAEGLAESSEERARASTSGSGSASTIASRSSEAASAPSSFEPTASGAEDASRREPPSTAWIAGAPPAAADLDRTSASATTARGSTAVRLAIVWAAGAGLLVLYQLVGRLALAVLARGARPVQEPAFRKELAAIAGDAGVRREIRLLRHERTRVPMTWGVRRPVILLPADARDWTAQRIRIVLQHEIAHVRRLDAFTQGLGRLACALHWFNPLAWWAAARLRAESEQAADDMVLRGGARASEYASHLLELVAALGHRSAPAGALPLAQRSSFEGRLLAILDPARERRGMRTASASGIAAGVVALVTLLGAAAPATAPRLDDGADPAVTDASEGLAADADDELAGRPNLFGAPDRPASPASDGNVDAPPAGLDDRLAAPARGGAAPVEEGSDRETARDEATDPVRDSASVAALSRALLTDADVEVRRTAAWALGELEDRLGTPALTQALGQDADAEVRSTAAWALGQIEDPAAAAALGAALDDESAEVRKNVLWALGQIESQEAVEPLSVALRDPEPEVRSQAAWALGQIESRAAVAPLTAALSDESEEVRRQAVWALGQIEDPSSATALTGALDDASAEVRRQAAWALGQIESAEAVPALAAALSGDEDAEVRRQAAWALGQIESAEAVDALAAALSDADPEVARTAAWSLGQIEPSSAPARLIEIARTGSGELRATALWALVQIEDPAAVPALVDALRDDDARIRTRALHGLADIGGETALQAITDLLQDPDPEVRAAAVRALAGGLRRGGDPNPNPNPNPNPQPRPRPNGG